MNTVKTVILLTAIGMVQQVSAMDNQAMQKMMAAMEQVQACMAGIDQGKLKELEGRSQAINAELSSLCQAGNRDKAQEQGMAYAKEITSNPEFNKMIACGKQLEEAMAGTPGMPAMPNLSFPEIDDNHHVCDQMTNAAQ